ncbi:hypothetical protein INR49_027250, partial [Caranx melampygus]
SWRNEFVSWEPQECGAVEITIPRKLLWVPDIYGEELSPVYSYVYLMSDGMVYDGQPIKVISSCRLDIYMFPFDTQNCTFSFNSYLYRLSSMEIGLLGTAEEILNSSKLVMSTMGEWELIEVKVKKFVFPAGLQELYEELRFYVSVRRRATMYVVNLLIPSCFLITVDLFSFLLPPKQVDRSLFKMTLILGYTVFLLIMNDLLPITGNTIPLINVFLSMCLALMVASLLETILITNLLCGSANYSPVPHWINVFVLHILGRLVRLPPKPRHVQDDTVIQNPAAEAMEMKASSVVEEVRDDPQQKRPLNEDKALEELRSLGRELQALSLQLRQQQGGNQSSEEWIHVGLIIDRLLFILYIIFISVSLITMTIIWIILRRRPILYVVNLLIPSCFLMALDLFSFLLPPASVDRSAFKMTLILGYTVFLLIMNDLLPVTGDETPLMNVLFSVSLALMVGSLLETVFITNIQFSSSQYSAVPHWLSVL